MVIMSRIQQLDAQIANMIAAGEVVERPMGVVKELVENAIDAGGTRIIVSMENGGIDRVTVEDNGCGMDRTDARTAFLRHATSKIYRQNDLWNIQTLGFRGEALPSIASVSKLTMCTSDGNDATKVVMEYGKETVFESFACPPGTRISVEGLFYRTPARLKHLRSAAYEGGQIQGVISSFALSHPEIAFRLFADERETFRTAGNGNLQEVIYQVYGRGPAENALPVSFEDFDYHVTGYLIRPLFTRANRSCIHVFLNGRMVRDFKLYRAVQDGYAGFVPQGRYPMCVLHITMDPHILDVNVHPGKWEVRLSKERQLEYLLSEKIMAALKASVNAAEVKPKAVQPEPVYYQPVSFTKEELAPRKEPEVQLSEEKVSVREAIAREMEEDSALLRRVTEVREPEPAYEPRKEEDTLPFPAVTYLGQFRDRYLIASCDAGLMLVDQKAAMQRVCYEQALREMERNTVMCPCLVPVTLHCGTGAVRRIDELNSAVKDLEITFEPFGEDTLLVREIPSWMQGCGEAELLTDIVDRFLEDARSAKEKMAFRRLAASAVGKARGIRRHMSREEAEKLLEQLAACENPWMSLQGKPVAAILDEKTLEKEFR